MKRNKSTILGAGVYPRKGQSAEPKSIWKAPKTALTIVDADTAYQTEFHGTFDPENRRKLQHAGPSPAPPFAAQEHSNIGIRAVGWNAPETFTKSGVPEQYAKTATKEFANLLSQPFSLEAPEGEGKDKYGRLLKRFRRETEEYSPENMTTAKKGFEYFGGVMIGKGLATVLTIGSNRKYSKRYRQIQARAMKDRKGIHSGNLEQ